MPKKQRKQLALNQVPTAIADLAHVTSGLPGKMILNWDRVEERDWAREWSGNIWHCGKGFKLKRGYRIEGYTFPKLTEGVRKEMEWKEDEHAEPPVDLRSAVERSKLIWEKMHAKTLHKKMRAIQQRTKKTKAKPKTKQIPS
jgi:hypothetical protein